MQLSHQSRSWHATMTQELQEFRHAGKTGPGYLLRWTLQHPLADWCVENSETLRTDLNATEDVLPERWDTLPQAGS